MKPCFGYVRVSTLRQGEGVSLDAQREAIEAFASNNNITITKWFEEQQTAAKSGRPVFSAMVKALRQRKADGLVMHKIDRSARNFRDWARVGELSDSGIDVHFATESLDFRSRGGRLSADIQAVIAADYIRNLKEEIQKGVRGQLERGLYPLKAPIGYLDNGGGKLKSLDPVRAPFIKKAFELYGSGQYSIRSLLAELEQMGLRNNRGKPISKGCLEQFLGNPFYTGVIKIKRTGAVYQGAHQPLIGGKLFELVQEIKHGKYHKKVTRHNHTYRGLFSCGHCNKGMIPEGQKGHVYYRCQSRDCPCNSIREELLEHKVHATLQRVQMSKDQMAWLGEEIEQWLRQRAPEKEAKSIALKISQLKEKLERLTDALIDRLIDQPVYNSRKQAMLLEKAHLEEQQQFIAKKCAQPERTRKFLELVKNLAEHYSSATSAQKREIVDIATSNRSVIDKNVYLEPANWLIATEQLLGVFSCGEYRPTSRTSPKVPNRQSGPASVEIFVKPDGFPKIENFKIEHLIEVANSLNAQRINDLFTEEQPKAMPGGNNYQTGKQHS